MEAIINFLKKLLGIATDISETRVVVDPEPIKVVTPSELNKMTKAQLEQYAIEDFGIDLDKRKTKAKMIEDLLAHIDQQ
jgi:hypothetical protein